MNHNEYYDIAGTKFSVKEICEAFGITRNQFSARVTWARWENKSLLEELIKGDRKKGRVKGAPRFNWLELNGEKKTVTGWAASLGISPTALNRRLKSGWTLEKALTTGKLSYSESAKRGNARNNEKRRPG